MFVRTIEGNLRIWQKSASRKPLILRGARQVGKTSVIRKFGTENFQEVIEINLEKKDQFELFDSVKTIDDFFKRVSLFFENKIVFGSTLLFIDEIQQSQNIMELLRFFAEEKPELHVIAAGSLLEVKMAKDWLVPVGRIDYRYLYPMTFFEYLQARGKTQLLGTLRSIKLNEKFDFVDLTRELFNEYLIVGGMPEAVNNYIQNQNYDDIKAIFNRLHTAYLDDIHKYARSHESYKYLELILEQGPKLAGSLFKYEEFGGSSYRGREMTEAINTVEKVMLLKQTYAINSTVLPVVPKTRRPKKMIWLDVGLSNFKNNIYSELIVKEFAGKVMEQIVGQSLIASDNQYPVNLYYWSRDRKEGNAEVDFCLQHNSRLVGIEVKSGNTTQMKSLYSLGNLDAKVILVRVSWDALKIETHTFAGKNYRILSLPVYLIDRWKELIDNFMERL